MNINENLKYYLTNNDHKFTVGEQIIIDYLIKHWHENPTASAIAAATQLSNSLVSKVFKKLGFKSIHEFYKIKNSSLEQSFQYLISVNQRNYEKTIIKNSIDKIKQFANSLIQYDNIFLYGIGHSNIAAINFQSRIRRIGYNATILKGRNGLVENAGLLKKNSIVILISNSGNTLAIRNVAKFCNENEIAVVLLTANIEGLAAKYCNEIYLFHTERNSFFIETLGSEEPAIQLLNIIYYYIINNNYGKAINNYKFSETFTEYY